MDVGLVLNNIGCCLAILDHTEDALQMYYRAQVPGPPGPPVLVLIPSPQSRVWPEGLAVCPQVISMDLGPRYIQCG